MLTQKTAESFWNCSQEIIRGNKLLQDMEKQFQNNEVRTLPDAFGRQRCLQLGIPSGQNGHQLLEVQPSLAKIIVEAHIKNKEVELIALNELVRLESNTEK